MHQQGAGVILQINSRLLLLVRGRYSGKWSFPKGLSDKHETLHETAERELYEETGIRVDIPRTQCPIAVSRRSKRCYFVCGVQHVTLDSLPAVCYPFALDTNEISEVRWHSHTSLARLKRAEVNLDVWTFLTNRAKYKVVT